MNSVRFTPYARLTLRQLHQNALMLPTMTISISPHTVRLLQEFIEQIPTFSKLDAQQQLLLILYALMTKAEADCYNVFEIEKLAGAIGIPWRITTIQAYLKSTELYMYCDLSDRAEINKFKLTLTGREEARRLLKEHSIENNTPTPSDFDSIVPQECLENTRAYINVIANEINGCYERGRYNACAVMTRRLLETLLIQALDDAKHDGITDQSGNYVTLEKLIGFAQSGATVSLSRGSKSIIKNVKKLGDDAAHTARFTAKKTDIDNIRQGFRKLVEELVHQCRF